MYLTQSDLALDCKFEDSGDSSGSDDWNTSASMMDLARQRQKMAKTKSANTSSLSPTCKNLPNGLAQPQHGLAQPQHVSYSQIKHLQMEKLKKSSATTTHSNTADRWSSACVFENFVEALDFIKTVPDAWTLYCLLKHIQLKTFSSQQSAKSTEL